MKKMLWKDLLTYDSYENKRQNKGMLSLLLDSTNIKTSYVKLLETI